jgi:argininosuccinate lyase
MGAATHRHLIAATGSIRARAPRRKNLHGAIAVLTLLGAWSIALAEKTPAPPAGDGSRFGRAKEPLAPEFKELYDYKANAKSLQDATFKAQTEVHRAHTIMLAEQGIISKDEASSILAGLGAVNAQADADHALQAYMSYETALIKEVGGVAGKMHIGRSRNDLANTINRMYYRDEVNRTIQALIELRKVLTNKAQENLDTIMVVYTHRKQAQPITLAHYLMAHAEAVGKSIQRFEDLYPRLNQSPLGAAASAGTGFPLNRDRTAELLGFDGLVVNSIEGVAGWDHIAEFASASSIHMAGLSRLASELQNWQTDEFDMIELHGSFAGSSSIMPQKKNPTAFEYTKQAAAETLGELVSVLASLNAIEYQHSSARVPLEPRAIDRVLAATHTMTGAVRTLTPKKDRMLQLVNGGFSTMTELTDTLVRESGLSFREAHDIIAHVVDNVLASGRQPGQIDTKMIQAAAVDTLGRRINIKASSVAAALDPRNNVARRDGVGGPAPSAVTKAIEATKQEIAAAETRSAQRQDKISQARAKLTAAEANLQPRSASALR